MAFEELGKPRYQCQNSANGLTITIPSKRNWFIILFLGFWLIGWAVGELSAIGDIFSSSRTTVGAFGGLFMIGWLGAWTVGGAFAIYSWLWQIAGVEEIVISHDSLKISKKIPLWTRTKEYRLQDVTSLRVSPSPSPYPGKMDFWGITGEQLAFDYGAKTVRFGPGIDEAEAKHIITEMQKVLDRIK